MNSENLGVNLKFVISIGLGNIIPLIFHLLPDSVSKIVPIRSITPFVKSKTAINPNEVLKV
jgi:hypothetical protein